MNNNLLVTKRNGEKESIDLEKIHKVVTWAAKGLKNVSVSQVEIKAQIQFYDGINTSEIHETLIKSAADLISTDAPDYQYLAARLAIFHLRKKAYGQFEPPALLEHVGKMVDMGKYDKHLLEDYTPEEFAEMDSYIDHWRDMNFSYAAVKQLEGKYLVQNRVTGEIYESAQFLYILVAACLFANYDKATRMDYIRRFYDAASTFKLSLPTPIMAGVRTPTRQFSSCVLIETGDSLDSINATASAIVKYVSQRAGIGVNAGRIRALGSPIRGGEAFHTGCIPFYKYFQTAVKSCSQGGVRGGAATLFYPIWHMEVESLLVLKNNRGVEENRVRHLDYGVQFNKLMYQRMMKDGYISLLARLTFQVFTMPSSLTKRSLKSYTLNTKTTTASAKSKLKPWSYSACSCKSVQAQVVFTYKTLTTVIRTARLTQKLRQFVRATCALKLRYLLSRFSTLMMRTVKLHYVRCQRLT